MLLELIERKKGGNMKKIYLIAGIALLFTLVFSQKGLAEDQILEKGPTLRGQKYVPEEVGRFFL